MGLFRATISALKDGLARTRQKLAGGLRSLLAGSYDVYVIHVLSREELDPDLQGDLRLVDCEDADQQEITVTAPLMKRYKQTLAAFLDGAKNYCSRRGMVYVSASSDTSVENLVLGYLRQRGLVR